MKRLSITALVLLLAAPATAEMYSWEDARGTLHFSDSAQASASRVGRLVQTPGASRSSRPATVAPLSSCAIAGHEILVPFESDGNLIRVDVRLNDSVVAPFYVASGATDIIVTREVADLLGLAQELGGSRAIEVTGGGSIEIPLVQLRSVELNGAVVENVRAAVNPNIEIGLLGASFLNNYKYSVDTAARILTLTPR